jgi:protein-tyrosine phosphatase
MASGKQVLFLCTGNYYRSRYAEILFNWKVRQSGLPWFAISRGLALEPRNPGPMSEHTSAALQKMGIPITDYLRMPMAVTDQDFQQADHCIGVKEAEHRALMASKFPAWVDRVEYWHVHDLDCSGPEQAIPHLDREVTALVERLRSRGTQ